MAALAGNQMLFGHLYKGSKSSLDISIGTGLYMLVCMYYLLEPGLSKSFRFIPVVLIAPNIFFIYRSMRRDYQLKPNDCMDIWILILGILLGVLVVYFSDFASQQLIYTLFILYFFVKLGILATRNRRELPTRIYKSTMAFLICYSTLFLWRTVYFVFVPPTAEIYLMESTSIIATVSLMVFYTLANSGVQIAASYRADEEKEELLNKALEEKDFATDLVKIIGHDLRGFLGSAGNATEMIQNRDDPAIPVIVRNSQKALTLLTDLVYWGRSRSGDAGDTEDFISVNVLLMKTAEEFQNDAIARDIGIEISDSSEIVRADITAVRVVLRNILSNALKFSDIGGTVRMSAFRENRNAGISISDSGPGMGEELLDEIHGGRFVRSGIDKTGKTGTGTGLRIVTSVCAAYDWDLKIESSPDRGTTISLYLPIHETES